MPRTRVSLNNKAVVVVVLPDSSEGWGHGGTLRISNSRATSQGLDQRSKMEKVVPKMARRRAQVRDNPRRGDLDPAEGVRTREGCDRGIEVGTVYSG